jgi:hypothetical protein
VNEIRWLQARNADSVTVPAFGVVAVTGVDSGGSITIARPSTDGQDGVLFAGPASIAPGALGLCHMTYPAIAAYDQDPVGGGIPATGETWGPGAGSWALQSGNAGFLIVGGADAGRVNVVPVAPTPDPNPSPAQSGYCNLAALQTTDCLHAAGPSDAVMMSPSGGRWYSTTPLTYPLGTGDLVFWLDNGRPRLTLTVAAGSGGSPRDLIFCPATGCFVGGPLTGHAAHAAGPCAGAAFSVCLSCVTCPTHASACCPADLLDSLYATLTEDGTTDCPFIAGAYLLKWRDTGYVDPAGPSWGATTQPFWISDAFACPGNAGDYYRLVFWCPSLNTAEIVFQVGSAGSGSWNAVSGAGVIDTTGHCLPPMFSFPGGISISGGGTLSSDCCDSFGSVTFSALVTA